MLLYVLFPMFCLIVWHHQSVFDVNERTPWASLAPKSPTHIPSTGALRNSSKPVQQQISLFWQNHSSSVLLLIRLHESVCQCRTECNKPFGKKTFSSFYSLPYRSIRFTSTKEQSYYLAYLCFRSNKCCMMQQSCCKSPALSSSLQGGLVPLAGCCYHVGGNRLSLESLICSTQLVEGSSHAVKQQGDQVV